MGGTPITLTLAPHRRRCPPGNPCSRNHAEHYWRLARKAKRIRFGQLGEFENLVTLQTLLKWHRKLIAKKYDSSAKRRKVGRPPTSGEIRQLVLRMAGDNPKWGYTRIKGALANTGHDIGRGPIANILKGAGREPAPERGRRTTWKEFLSILECAGVKSLRLPPRSPNLNAYAERFVRSIKEECLGWMIFFSERQLRTAVSEYVEHYHHERNHQGRANRLIEPALISDQAGTVVRDSRLGGLLNHYRRVA